MKLLTIKLVYDELNKSHFSGALTRPRILIKRWRNAYAQYVTTHRENTLEFNLRRLKYPQARSVIYHEMVHQYVEEILDIQEDDHHGEIFWKVYKWFAIDSDVELAQEFD
jgi:hypothetical protein